MKKGVLFLCTNNSCRSQMAEGLVNHYLGDKIAAFSAGTAPTVVNPRAVKSMAEIGIDISGHRSKGLEEFAGRQFDYVITLCDSANEECPIFFGGVQKIHMGFADPATVTGNQAEIMAAFRWVRDDIKDKILKFFDKLNSEGGKADTENR